MKDGKYKFSEPIFYDGLAWNYLKYDPSSNKIDLHICLSSKMKEDSYVKYMNIVDTNVKPAIIEDNLYLYISNGEIMVKFSVMESSKYCMRRRYLLAEYNFVPMNMVSMRRVKMVRRMERVGNENWDMIVDYVNRLFL